jgi:hypothetical protein
MYNTSFIVKYYDIENDLLLKLHSKTDDHPSSDETYSEQDVIDICEKLYRDEILSVFNVETIDDDIINTTIKEIYDKMIQCSEFKQLLEQLNDIFGSIQKQRVTEYTDIVDLEFIFVMLFSQPLFHLAHKCICEFCKNTTISNHLLVRLKENAIILFNK